LTQEFRFGSLPASTSKWKWILGNYWFMQKNPVKQATRFGRDAMLTGAPDTLFSIINTMSADNYGMSVYGQATYAIKKNVQLTVGLRYDRERRELGILSEYQKDPNPDPVFALVPDTAAAVTFTAFSPKAALLFSITDNTNLYLSYSRGYRAGGLTQLSADPSQPPLHPYEPEYSDNFEIGIKNNLFSNRLYVNASVFIVKADNVQVPTLILPDAITVTRNSGELVSKGAEVELRSAPIKNLQLASAFGYTHATYRTLRLPRNGEAKDFSGNRQVFTPELTTMLAAQYDFVITPRVKLIARSEWLYFGSQYFDLANSIRQGSFHLLNANIGVSIKDYELIFWSRNLTDTRYIDYAYDFGGVHLANPRTYGLTARIRI